jgi:hypothetical protein
MVQEANNPEQASLRIELDAALNRLESALGEAVRAAEAIRAIGPQIDNLAGVVVQMEAAMSRARQQLSPSSLGRGSSSSPAAAPLGLVPPREPAREAPRDETASDEVAGRAPSDDEALREVIAEAPVDEVAPEATNEPAPNSAAPATPHSEKPTNGASAKGEDQPAKDGSHCLRVDVWAKSGSLDLKAVDRSINETPAVADVALLDYDGRSATLKVWVDASDSAAEVRRVLLESFRRHLAEHGETEVHIGFEGTSVS